MGGGVTLAKPGPNLNAPTLFSRQIMEIEPHTAKPNLLNVPLDLGYFEISTYIMHSAVAGEMLSISPPSSEHNIHDRDKDSIRHHGSISQQSVCSQRFQRFQGPQGSQVQGPQGISKDIPLGWNPEKRYNPVLQHPKQWPVQGSYMEFINYKRISLTEVPKVSSGFWEQLRFRSCPWYHSPGPK